MVRYSYQFFSLLALWTWYKVYKRLWWLLNENNIEIYVSKIVLIIKLFFQTFWENILISFIIMFGCYLQLNKSIGFCFHKVYNTFLSATSCWSSVSRTNIDSSWSDGLPCNLSTWICENMVFPVLFQVSKD